MKEIIKTETKKVAKTVYEYKDINETYYVSDDGLQISKDEYKIKNYEKSLIDDKIFNITPLEQFPDDMLEQSHCGFAFYITKEEDYQLFKKKHLENYSYYSDDVKNIYNRWFTYYVTDGGDYRDNVYFVFFDDMEININKTMSIINKFRNEDK